MDASVMRAQILASEDRKSREVQAEAWGGPVWLTPMDGRAREQFDRWMAAERQEAMPRGMREKLLVLCITDAVGNRVFGDDDFEVLGTKNATVLDRLFDIAMLMNGLSAKAQAETEKN